VSIRPNPLLEGLGLRRKPEACALVIFGASGDLTRRKLFPALYALAYRRLLPERFAVVGVARTEQTARQFVSAMRGAVKEYGRDPYRADVWESLAAGVRYVSTDFAGDQGQDRAGEVLDEIDRTRGTGGNRLHYLAVPPQAFETVLREIGERREREEGWTRVIVEKPFGHDLASARSLTASVRRWFAEDEIFRIDHYLGKETVQNMLALRFANGIFEPIWNRQFVDHVQITVAESMGIEGRFRSVSRATSSTIAFPPGSGSTTVQDTRRPTRRAGAALEPAGLVPAAQANVDRFRLTVMHTGRHIHSSVVIGDPHLR